MRHRFDRCHADECRKPQVDSAKLIAVSLKIGPDEDIVFAIEGFDVLEPPGARNLLRKDAMKLGIDTMRLDRGGDHLAHCLLDRLRGNLGQRSTDDLHDVLIVMIDDGGNERLLAGEILVERADADARHLGDAVGAGSVETLPDQNASCRFNKRVNRRA